MALEDHIERIGSLDERKVPEQKDLAEWQGRLRTNLCQVEVGLPVFLGDTEIPISELLDLKKEDVIVIDKRISESVMPNSNLSSGLKAAWVILAGCSINESTFPRLTARVMRSKLFISCTPAL